MSRNKDPRLVLAVALAAAVTGTACRQPPGEEVLVQAETLIRNQEYDRAVPLVKEFLCHYPDHSGAHYYLGRCYRDSTESYWLELSLGEINTALHFFYRDGKRSTIKRFKDEYFEMICHVDVAKIRLKQAMYLVENNGDPRVIGGILDEADSALERARRAKPGAAEIPPGQESIDELRRLLRTPDRPGNSRNRRGPAGDRLVRSPSPFSHPGSALVLPRAGS